MLASQECLWTQQGIANLLEDEDVEFVGADIALRATAVFPSGPERIVVLAVVVPMEGAIAAAHLVARHTHAAVSALDQPTQQPVSGFGTPGVPPRVVAADTLCRLEQRLVEDRRNCDGDPLIARALHLPGFARVSALRHGFGSIVRVSESSGR